MTLGLFSQEGEQNIYKLNVNDLSPDVESDKQEVVSASRSSKFVEDLPVTVYVITREEILQNGYTSLADVLKSVPGIKVSQPGSAIEGETFLMRGLFGNYYTKILVDNVPVQPSVVSGMPIGDQLPIRQAERIEIILGPASAVYGADALAGVINIVTMTSERPVYAQADIAVGDFGQEYLNVMIGGKIGKNKNVFGYKLYGNTSVRGDMNVKYNIPEIYDPSIYDSSGSYLSAPYYRGDSSVPEMNRLPDNSRLIGLGLKFKGFSFDYQTMFRKIQSSIGQNTAVYSYADPTNTWGERIQRYRLGYEKSWTKVSTLTNLTYLRYRLDEESSFGLIYDGGVNGRGYKYAASDDIILEEIITYMPLPKLELTGGLYFQYSGNLPKTNDLPNPFNPSDYKPFSTEKPETGPPLWDFGYNPVVFTNIAGFLQVFYVIRNFTIMLSDRYDFNSLYGPSNNPRLALMYKINDRMSLRASYGSAFRAPSAYYTYSSLAYTTDEGIYYDIVPNHDLKPEKIQSVDIGWKWRPVRNIHLDLTIYYHNLKEQFTRSGFILDTNIYPNPVNDSLFTNAYVNGESTKATLLGAQINLRVSDIVPAIRFDLDVFLSFAKGYETLPYGFGNINNYRQMPEFMGQINFSLAPWDRLYFYFRNIISGGWEKRFFPLPPEVMEAIGLRTEVKGFYTLDMIMRFLISKNFQAFLQVNNIFNTRYGGIDAYGNQYDLVYNPQYGRNFRLGLSFNLE